MKTKLTTCERRAAALCGYITERLADGLDAFPVTVEWVKSRTWGSNPRIMHHGEKCSNVSGCGYCKHSTCLADVLRFLAPEGEARDKIHSTGGAGVASVADALKAAGFLLEYVTGTPSTDCYFIRKA